MSTPNPFAVAKAQLLATLTLPPPPASYRYRLIALMALCGVFFLLCLAQILLSMLDTHRRGKRIWLVRVQRLRAGSILVFNNLILFGFFGCACAAVMWAGRFKDYQVTYLGASAYNATAIQFLAFHFPMLAAVTYSYANLSAVSTLSKGRGIEVAGRLWILIHNSVLPILMVLWFSIVIPCSVEANKLVNSSPAKLATLLALLTEAAAAFDSTGSAGELAIAVAAASEDVANTTKKAVLYTKIVVGMGSSYSIGITIAACASTTFVLKLRKQSYLNRSRSEGPSIFVTREERTVVEAPDRAEYELSPTFKKPSIAFSQQDQLPFSQAAQKTDAGRTRNRVVEGGEAAALTRLARDLSLSLPFVLVSGLVFPSIGVFTLSRIEDTSWPMREFAANGFVWIVVCTNIILGTYFIYNFFMHPSRYQQDGVTTKATSIGSGFVTSRAPRAGDGIQITMHAQSGTHILDNQPVEFSVTDFDSTKNASQKDLADDVEKFEGKW